MCNIAVQSRLVVGWIESEPLWLFCPCLADELERCEAVEGFESLGIVVGIEEGRQVGLQPFVVVVVVAAHSSLFESAVHSFDLAVRPRMVRLGESMIDVVLCAGQFE